MKTSIIILSFTLICTGCTINPQVKPVIYGPGVFYAKWQNAILKECNNRAAMITLQIVDEKIKEGYTVTEADVYRIHKYLVEKCSLNSGIVI
jgi:hypothetical protein